MVKTTLASHFKPEDVTAGFLAELRETADFLFRMEGFNECFATRKGFTKMSLTERIKTLDEPDQLVLGAPSVESVTFVKTAGDFPGSLLIYKDRLMFHSTASYRLASLDKERELAKMKADLVTKANGRSLFFEGELEKFSLSRLASFNKIAVLGFLQDVKQVVYGLSLKPF